MIGLTPDQLAAAWIAVELLSFAFGAWLYSKRYSVRGLAKRFYCHL